MHREGEGSFCSGVQHLRSNHSNHKQHAKHRKRTNDPRSTAHVPLFALITLGKVYELCAPIADLIET